MAARNNELSYMYMKKKDGCLGENKYILETKTVKIRFHFFSHLIGQVALCESMLRLTNDGFLCSL